MLYKFGSVICVATLNRSIVCSWLLHPVWWTCLHVFCWCVLNREAEGWRRSWPRWRHSGTFCADRLTPCRATLTAVLQHCSTGLLRTVSVDLGPVSWRPTTVKWRQFSQSNRHSTIITRQTEYHKALPSSAKVQSHLSSLFTDDGKAL